MIVIVALTLFPLALYCFVLAAVNRRRHPLIVSGTWDFLGTVLGASGFLLFAGPYILNNLNERWREQWLVASADPTAEVGDAGHQLWWWVRAAYVLVVVVSVAWLLYRRRQTLSIYNINPDAVPEVVGQVLDGFDMHWQRQGNVFLVLDPARAPQTVQAHHRLAGVRKPDETGVVQGATMAQRTALMPPTAASAGVPELPAVPLLTVDCFRSLHHATIQWADHGGSRPATIENELRRALAEVNTSDNPAAQWFLWFACGLFALLVLLLTSWIGLILLSGPRPM